MNYCYITVLTNRSYLGGVKVLKASLDRVHAKYPFFVLIPRDIDPKIPEELRNCGISVLYEDPFHPEIMRRENNPVDYWRDTIFKLKIFQLTVFDKLIFLDADMIVIRNIDSFFDYPHMSCTAAGQVLHKDWIHLNSGFMVIEPNDEDYSALVDLIAPICDKKIRSGSGFGDQDVIEAMFDEDWQNDPERKLPETCNVMLGYAGPLYRKHIIHSIKDIYVYHFTGRQKPWRKTFQEDAAILAKIVKRGGNLIDFQVFSYYKKILKSI